SQRLVQREAAIVEPWLIEELAISIRLGPPCQDGNFVDDEPHIALRPLGSRLGFERRVRLAVYLSNQAADDQRGQQEGNRQHDVERVVDAEAEKRRGEEVI